MFQKVSQTELLGSLKCRAYLLCDVEVRTSLGLFVVKNVVIEPVGELAMAYFRIKGKLLRSHGHDTEKEHDQTDESFYHS